MGKKKIDLQKLENDIILREAKIWTHAIATIAANQSVRSFIPGSDMEVIANDIMNLRKHWLVNGIDLEMLEKQDAELEADMTKHLSGK